MATLNQLSLIGNVGTSPEMRFTPSGRPVTNFTLASNHRFVNSNGERKEETDWFSVVVWGQLAENVNQFVSKGSLVFVQGRVTLHKWTGKQDGLEHTRLEVQANKVIFLDKTIQQGDNTGYEPESEEVPF